MAESQGRLNDALAALARVRAVAEEAASAVHTQGRSEKLLPPEAALARRVLAALDTPEET